MIPLIEKHRGEIEALCRRFAVNRLELFGSAVKGAFNPESSDLDFLVEFRRDGTIGPADQYFGLLFELERVFSRKIDLVCATALHNPYFVQEVNRTRKMLYAA